MKIEAHLGKNLDAENYEEQLTLDFWIKIKPTIVRSNKQHEV